MNYDNSNRGALFKNDKQGNEKRPDYTGSINVGGTDYQLSAWIKASKAGSKYMSLSVQPKRERADDRQPERGAQSSAGVPGFDDPLDSEIPF